MLFVVSCGNSTIIINQQHWHQHPSPLPFLEPFVQAPKPAVLSQLPDELYFVTSRPFSSLAIERSAEKQPANVLKKSELFRRGDTRG